MSDASYPTATDLCTTLWKCIDHLGPAVGWYDERRYYVDREKVKELATIASDLVERHCAHLARQLGAAEQGRRDHMRYAKDWRGDKFAPEQAARHVQIARNWNHIALGIRREMQRLGGA